MSGNSKTDLSSYWNKWASVWDITLRLVRLDCRYREQGISVLNLRKGMTVLDIACGTGLNFPYLFSGSRSGRSDYSSGNGCGMCAKVCSRGVYEIQELNGRKISIAVNAANCVGDGSCHMVCKPNAMVCVPRRIK